jgi:hypothetical protein
MAGEFFRICQVFRSFFEDFPMSLVSVGLGGSDFGCMSGDPEDR